MKRLSANTLFHFTNQHDNLVNILKNDFSPRICIEQLSPFMNDEIAIPMVCFCDIPLSQIKSHSEQYGSYGIGLNKEWGERNGVTPVMYFQGNANHTSSFSRGYKTLKAEIDINSNSALHSSFVDIMYTTWFYKPYEGKMWRGDHYTKPIRFYDEREWRYIPTLDEMKYSHISRMSLRGEEVDQIKRNPQIKEEINKSLSGAYKLPFKPSDVKYIIVSREDEIPMMIGLIRDIKEKYKSQEIDILCTRIISMESIQNDF